jgi:hypothetical protein
MGVVPGQEKMNDTCAKTMQRGMMDRGFTVHILGCGPQKTSVRWIQSSV